MITKLIIRLRNLIEDKVHTDYMVAVATDVRTFDIIQENVSEVTGITVNGVSLTLSDYSYDAVKQIVTINSGKVVVTDIVNIYYKYYKYSNSELLNYIESALDFLSMYNYASNYMLSTDETSLYPIPNRKDQSIIIMIASILIKPDYNEKKLLNMSVKYPRNLSKEQVIERLISVVNRDKIGQYLNIDLSLGVSDEI
jgi:hypothetical protein